MAVLDDLANLSVLIFVITNMLAMGLSLTVAQILQPLYNLRIVGKALLANFVLVPLVAYVLVALIPLEQGLAIGLILVGTAAGAPFLPKLVQFSKANIAFGVGLMVLLMVVTIFYMPLVLPLLLPGTTVNAGSIAASLVVLLLIPLAVGLLIKKWNDEIADTLQPAFNRISTIFLVVLIVLYLGVGYQTILGTFGTGAIGVAIVFILISLGIGYVLGGPARDTKPVVGLATAQRNISAAFVVVIANFATNFSVMAMVLVVSLIGLIILMIVSGEIGKRSPRAGTAQPEKGRAEMEQQAESKELTRSSPA
ncbi:MAG: bile acid:sodium symporter family protein [Halobacteriota archaeon]